MNDDASPGGSHRVATAFPIFYSRREVFFNSSRGRVCLRRQVSAERERLERRGRRGRAAAAKGRAKRFLASMRATGGPIARARFVAITERRVARGGVSTSCGLC